MTRRDSESGFTLLEVLVASILLGMLITILTMVFNSSSIAWSTGKAGVAEMDATRNVLAAAEVLADDLLPGVEKGSPNTWGVSVSPWKSDGALRTKGERAVEKISENKLAGAISGKLALPQITRKGDWLYDGGRMWADLSGLREMRISGSAMGYVVGVWSYGPDGLPDTDDDISTWPDVD